MDPESDTLPSPGPGRAAWGYRAVTWSVVCAALGYLVFSLWSGWQDVATAAGQVGLGGFAIALTMSLVNYGLRFVRWQTYLSAMGHAVPWRPSLRIYLSGFALTTTPGKAGETIRGVMLKRRGVPYPVSFAAFFSERLSDLLAVVLLALLGLALYPPARAVVTAGAVLVVTGLLLLGSARSAEWIGRHFDGSSRAGVALRHLLTVLRQARQCHAPRVLSVATALSVLAWGAEAWAFHLVLEWMNVEMPLTSAVFVYAVAMLGGALSFMPGGLGGAEAIMVAMLVWLGVGAPEAVAATVIIRAATLWFAVLIGIGAAALRDS